MVCWGVSKEGRAARLGRGGAVRSLQSERMAWREGEISCQSKYRASVACSSRGRRPNRAGEVTSSRADQDCEQMRCVQVKMAARLGGRAQVIACRSESGKGEMCASEVGNSSRAGEPRSSLGDQNCEQARCAQVKLAAESRGRAQIIVCRSKSRASEMCASGVGSQIGRAR